MSWNSLIETYLGTDLGIEIFAGTFYLDFWLGGGESGSCTSTLIALNFKLKVCSFTAI